MPVNLPHSSLPSPRLPSTQPRHGHHPHTMHQEDHSLPVLGPFHLGCGDPRGPALQLHLCTGQAQHLLGSPGSKHGRRNWVSRGRGDKTQILHRQRPCGRPSSVWIPSSVHPSLPIHPSLKAPWLDRDPALYFLSSLYGFFVARNTTLITGLNM